MSCKVTDCPNKVAYADLCSTHYKHKLAGKLVFEEYVPASPATVEEIMAVMSNTSRNPPEYCGVRNCARPHDAANVCRPHYMRAYNYHAKRRLEWPNFRIQTVYDADVTKYAKPPKHFYLTPKERKCHVPNCYGKYMGRGLCKKHYSRWYKTNRSAGCNE